MAPALKANRLEKEFKTASDDRKEQIVDDLDVEELFSNAEWPSQPENVTSTAYEIENPTTVAGVRG